MKYFYNKKIRLGSLHSAISTKDIVVVIINKYFVTEDGGVNFCK